MPPTISFLHFSLVAKEKVTTHTIKWLVELTILLKGYFNEETEKGSYKLRNIGVVLKIEKKSALVEL